MHDLFRTLNFRYIKITVSNIFKFPVRKNLGSNYAGNDLHSIAMQNTTCKIVKFLYKSKYVIYVHRNPNGIL